MWEDLIRKAKDGGLDVIDTYVFWNGHEPSPGHVPYWNFIFFFHLTKLIHSISYLIFILFGWFFIFQYNFEGSYDLVRFIKTVQRVGLYAHLRIGPYVCAEWNFGYLLS